MQRLRKLPPAFKRFKAMGGVLEFAIFEEADGSEEDILAAFGHAHGFDIETLRGLGSRRIGERAFFGDWYDPPSGSLLKLGSFTTAEGEELQNPKLKTLDRVDIRAGGAPIPDAGAGGQFCYAFAQPPYQLRGRPSEIQSIFDEIRDFILPAGTPSEIRDWASPRLPEVSPLFSAGMDWWGVFLFSIHVPAIPRLTLIAGSTTD